MSSHTRQHPAYAVSRPVLDYATVRLASNPGPMTLDGTNTWIVGAPEAEECVVIDPGPAEEEHLRAVGGTRPVAGILLTHHHPDHTEAVTELARRTGAPVRAADPEWCTDSPAGRDSGFGTGQLRDGEVVTAAGLRLRVLATPGHTADSVCLHTEHGGVPAVFAGDSLLGRGTTVVMAEDGHLGSYLESLRRLTELPEGTWLLPGHGPELPGAPAVAEHYLAHRRQRLDQVRTAVRGMVGEIDAARVVDVVYTDIDPAVRPAAESTVLAQLEHLRELGEL
ncbi:MBL fold metallo-hydrolase [Actinopolyspora mortivallis]|uniref:MBL fold metallo-hydrolase n=1 Tax=Actinopolyspora mortivallis TaxID=33906 RepID=A0A2T0GWB4_ACTMO|nr:MBL fold metallo-hydrolase [Actinopolyspora mortivallis]PRW63387.1 MBL fold metallo-hydrolase [Actinopolyspora mortivallis]